MQPYHKRNGLQWWQCWWWQNTGALCSHHLEYWAWHQRHPPPPPNPIVFIQSPQNVLMRIFITYGILYLSEAVKLPRRYNLPVSIMYYGGSCDDGKSDISEKFISILQDTSFASICTGNEQCTAENVAVTCGSTSDRKRRSAVNDLVTYSRLGTSLTDYDNLTAIVSMVSSNQITLIGWRFWFIHHIF